jgi:tRNA(Ile)-lysidine synthase TilS/MesJ
MKNNLVKEIKELNKNDNYDCLLMFSGGKDSSYLLYYLAVELKLRVMTVTLTHNFLTVETRQNIESFANRFAKKHISIENTSLNQSGKHFLETWINQPDEGSLITLCTGCRLGLIEPIIEIAKKENMNIVITGDTPFEETNYRMSLVNYPKGKEGILYFFIGYLRLLVRNLSLLKNIKAFITQIKEFYFFKNKKKIYNKTNIHQLRPFYDNIKYDESLIIDKLLELNWKKPTSTTNNSYWRSDCNMYAIRHYFYNQVAGYNEMKDYYGKLHENKLISQEYLDQNTSKHYEKEEIIELLKSLELSEKSISKYQEFVKNFANSDIPFPDCGSCKGLRS